MEFSEYVGIGIRKCGSGVELAKPLEQNPAAIGSAKAHMRRIRMHRACEAD